MAGLCFIIDRILKYKTDTTKENLRAVNKPTKEVDVDGAINNAIMAYEHSKADYDDAINKGATPEQLAALKKDVDKLKWVKDNETIIRLGAPYFDSLAKNLLKAIK